MPESQESRVRQLEQRIINNEKRIVDHEKLALGALNQKRKDVFERFPLLFTLLGSFGLVATFYGFEGIIDRIDILSDNPFILLGVGLLILIFSGSLYKKLQ